MASTSMNMYNKVEQGEASDYWLRKTEIRQSLGLCMPEQKTKEEIEDIMGCDKNRFSKMLFVIKSRLGRTKDI